MAAFNYRTACLLRRLRHGQLTAQAWIGQRAFCCQALAGRAEENLCINSDLTVSCSGHDVEGTARIGNLARQSLIEIFTGERAQGFRDELALGRLPLAECARCTALRVIDREEACRQAREFDLPQSVQVENTSACTLHCASCPRQRLEGLRTQRSMSLDDIRRVTEALKELPIRHIGYVGFGEPFLSHKIGLELAFLRRALPDVQITSSTNALFIDSDEKREAALLLDQLQISLHGADQATAARYQCGIDFDRAYNNMRHLVAYRDARGRLRPRVIWKYLLFRWNERKSQLCRALELARQAGVDGVDFEKTVSPLHGLPWRYYLGLLNHVGRPEKCGLSVALR